LPQPFSSIIGSRKSGPVLKALTLKPWREWYLAKPAVMEVLPCPEPGALMSSAGHEALRVKTRLLVVLLFLALCTGA
jgi:hypothetical protein